MEQNNQLTHYKAKVLFEISFNACGNNYLIIYGRHVNGYFCCIPNWKISCEMAEPSDVFYNRSKLVDACIGMNAADAIAKAIRDTSEAMNLKTFFAKYKASEQINTFVKIYAKDIKTAYEDAEELKCGSEQLVAVYTDKEFLELLTTPKSKSRVEDND